MKKLTFLAILAFVPMILTAQFRGKGTVDINAGIGLGSTLPGSGLPISVSYDQGFNENISIGGYLGFAQTSESVPFFGDITYTNIILGARGVYHKDVIDEVSTYGGAMLGWNIQSVDAPAGFNANGSGLQFGFFVGGRYSFTDTLGAYAELGYGVSFLSLGVTYAFK